MMFEYRFYECTPGRLAEEVARMHEVAIAPWPGHSGGYEGKSLFDRFGIPRPIGAWTSIAGRRQPIFGYMLCWDSLDRRDRAFPPFWACPEWAEVRARTDDGHPMVDGIEDWLVAPSKIWDRTGGFDDTRHGGLHEMRIHHVLAGYAPQVAEYLSQVEHRQIEILGGRILGVFDVAIGPDMPAVVTFVAWPDHDTQQFAADRLEREPRVHDHHRRWREEHGLSLIRRVEQTLLQPLDYALPLANFGIAP